MFDHGFPSDWSTIKKLIWLKGTSILGGGGGIWKTVTGAILHITDALAAPVKELSVAVQSDDGVTGCNIRHTGANICGGEWLKERLVFSMPTGTLDEDAKTFKFTSGISAPYYIYSKVNYPFKENTRYTFIITCSKSSGTSTNLRVTYTDGSYDNLSGIPTTKTMNVFVTASGKTVDHFMKYTASGTTTLYYEESGIFEGVLTASDFEPYVGTVLPISWQTEAGSITSGTLTIAEDGSVTLDSGGTHQLESITPITLFADENNIWADCGDSTLTYQAISDTAIQ